MGVDTSNGSRAMDYSEHERTYTRFIKGCILAGTLSAMFLIMLAVILL